MSALKLWQESISEYAKNTNSNYTIPKKGTTNYNEVKKIYDKKRGQVNKSNVNPESKSKKSCKCRCSCNCPKP